LAWGNENSNTGLSPSPSSSATTSCIEVSLTFGVPQSVNLFVLHCEKHPLPIHLVRNSFWFLPSHADCQLWEDNQPPQEERWSATMHLLWCDEFRHRTTPTRSPPLKNILQSQIVNFKPDATTSNCNIDHQVPGPETYACLKNWTRTFINSPPNSCHYSNWVRKVELGQTFVHFPRAGEVGRD
jgi:hypothetical protein